MNEIAAMPTAVQIDIHAAKSVFDAAVKPVGHGASRDTLGEHDIVSNLAKVASSLAKALQNQVISNAHEGPGRDSTSGSTSDENEQMRAFVRPLAEEWTTLLPALDKLKQDTQKQLEDAQRTARDAVELYSSHASVVKSVTRSLQCGSKRALDHHTDNGQRNDQSGESSKKTQKTAEAPQQTGRYSQHQQQHQQQQQHHHQTHQTHQTHHNHQHHQTHQNHQHHQNHQNHQHHQHRRPGGGAGQWR